MPPDAPDYALLDRAGVGGAMFYPRPNDAPPPSGASDYAIPAAPDVEIGARFYLAASAFPTVLYFHGNGEVASDHDGIAPLYHAIGLNLFVAEFRGYGESTGTPSFASLVADAHPVASFFHATLEAAGCAPARFVMGRSLGAHPALELAANAAERFAGVIIESGAGGLRRMLARVGLLDTELGGTLAAAHEAKIASIGLPALLLHGEYDELVPLSTAEALQTSLVATSSRLEVIPGAGHNDILWVGREQYFAAIAEFVGEYGAG
ncbi:MAG: alpha/beta hydrolase [Chloroflexi bacterium]|nr:alpha/beta hydrolase [Chloroflexota bacterium]MDA1003893.1 alpha/beta hydrolase [Chloroflexota bacterium]